MRGSLLSLFAAITVAFAASAAQPPNILFILADDMGWQDTSVPFADHRTPLNERFKTPAMERLAGEGMKFTQAYATTVCSPSRVSLLTGRNEARHHVTQWTLYVDDPPSSDLPHPTLSSADWNWSGLQPEPSIPHAYFTPSLPQRLHDHGYRTMIIGKGHLGAKDTPAADPQTLGFDVRIGGRFAGGPGSYSGLKNFASNGDTSKPWRAWDLEAYWGQDIHLTEALTREAAREIRSAVAADQPFFCFLTHYAPHTPIEPDERFAPAFRAAGLDEPEAAYASLIAGVDKSVGDLMALLEELDVADNTLVVFMSDNGGLSHERRGMSPPHTHNAPLSSGKGSHHEGGIRVPLLVSWPGVIPAATSNPTPVMIYDWFATLLHAAGASASADAADLDGLNLLPLLLGKTAPAAFERPLVWHFPNSWGPLNFPPVEGPGMGPCSVIREGDWKLIYYHSDQLYELFNLRDDLSEQHNLAAAEPTRVTAMATELARYLQERDAPMPIITATGQPVPYPPSAPIAPSIESTY